MRARESNPIRLGEEGVYSFSISSISGHSELPELQNVTDQDYRRLETSSKKPICNTGKCLRCVPLLELDMNPNLEISASAIASLPFVGGLVSRPVVILRQSTVHQLRTHNMGVQRLDPGAIRDCFISFNDVSQQDVARSSAYSWPL